MVEQVVKALGRIDILVNVAGILRDRMIFNMTEAEWDAVIAVHLKGTFNTIRAASIHMREQKGGRIISMSSVSALGAPGQPNYAAAKAGIIGLTWSTANAHGEVRRHRNAIMPSGATRMIDSTPRGPRGLRADRQVAERAGRGHRARSRQRGAAGRLSLASDAAANVNGQVFHSFGYGYTLLAQPQAIRRLEGNRRLTPEELARAVPGDARRRPQGAAGHRLRARRSTSGRRRSGRISARRAGFWKSPWEERVSGRPPHLSRQHVSERDGARAPRADAGRARRRRTHPRPLGRRRPRTRATACWPRSTRASCCVRSASISPRTTITSTDLRRHRDLLAESDLVVTMTAEQREIVEHVSRGAPGGRSSPCGSWPARPATSTIRSGRARSAIAPAATRSRAAWASRSIGCSCRPPGVRGEGACPHAASSRCCRRPRWASRRPRSRPSGS